MQNRNTIAVFAPTKKQRHHNGERQKKRDVILRSAECFYFKGFLCIVKHFCPSTEPWGTYVCDLDLGWILFGCLERGKMWLFRKSMRNCRTKRIRIQIESLERIVAVSTKQNTKPFLSSLLLHKGLMLQHHYANKFRWRLPMIELPVRLESTQFSKGIPWVWKMKLNGDKVW